jgi:hypothetical protein
MGDAAGTDADAIEPPQYFDQGITKGKEGGVSKGRANEHEASNSGQWSHRLAARSHGRVRGTSWHAATMLVLRCLREAGIRVVCAHEIQLIEDRIASLGVGHMFQQHDRIIAPGDGLFLGPARSNQS